MQKRQGLLKVLAFLHFRDFSYSPFHFFVEKEPLLIATALFLMNFLIIDLFADKQAACKNS